MPMAGIEPGPPAQQGESAIHYAIAFQQLQKKIEVLIV